MVNAEYRDTVMEGAVEPDTGIHAPPDDRARRVTRGYRTAVWVAQYTTCLVFLSAGLLKSFMPLDLLANYMSWAADYPKWFVRSIGATDLLGAVGIVLPAWTRILPGLGTLAAFACTTVLVLGTCFHTERHEPLQAAINVPLVAIAAFAFWGRWKHAPIEARRIWASGGKTPTPSPL